MRQFKISGSNIIEVPYGGWGAAIAMLLAIIILWIFWLIASAIYKMIASAIEDAKEGKWGKAILLTTVAMVSVVLIVGAMVSVSIEAAAKQAQNQARRDALTAEIAWAKANSTLVLSIKRIRGEWGFDYYGDHVVTCDSSCGDLYGEYQVTNNLHLISLYLSDYRDSDCKSPKGGSLGVLKPGQTATIYCLELDEHDGVYQPPSNVCITAKGESILINICSPFRLVPQPQ